MSNYHVKKSLVKKYILRKSFLMKFELRKLIVNAFLGFKFFLLPSCILACLDKYSSGENYTA